MRKGFTFIELVFVIVVMGILAKFGSNLLATSYQSAASSSINNRLQVDTELTLNQLSNRLQYRIKDSIITRTGVGGAAVALSSSLGTPTVLEWVGYDIDGWLGINNGTFNAPSWSGFIDVNDAGAIAALNYLESPATDTGVANTIIQALSVAGTDINDSAIFFTGANSDVTTDYGWNNAQNFQSTTAAHRIGSGAPVTRLFDMTISTFLNTNIYENYKLAWTAYAVRLMDFDTDGNIDDLVLYYDYQPWTGETFSANGTPVLLLSNVDTFKFQGIGDTVKLQICVNEENTLGGGVYAVCKETAIF